MNKNYSLYNAKKYIWPQNTEINQSESSIPHSRVLMTLAFIIKNDSKKTLWEGKR